MESMSGEQLRVVVQCLKCGKQFEDKMEALNHLSAWDRTEHGEACPARVISMRVVR